MTDAIAAPIWDHVSASQIRTHGDCNRQWFYEKILGVERVMKSQDSLDLGKIVHKDIEDYLSGVSDSLSHPLLADNTWLSQVKARDWEIRTEQAFRDTSFRKPAEGFIDLVLVDRVNKIVEVWDHKTTKNWKYMKKEAALRADPQAQLYLLQAWKEFGDEYRYFFGHHVILTSKTEEQRTVSWEASLEQIEEGRRCLERRVVLMMLDSQALDVGSVEPNYSACWAYGGCPFKAYCKEGKPLSLFNFKKTTTDAAAAAGTTLDTVGVTTTTPVGKPLLYLDCMPVGSGTRTIYWNEWVSDLAAEYQQEVGEHYLMSKYNEGAKAIANIAWQGVLTGKRSIGGLVLSSNNLAAVLFSELAGDSVFLVRGVK